MKVILCQFSFAELLDEEKFPKDLSWKLTELRRCNSNYIKQFKVEQKGMDSCLGI